MSPRTLEVRPTYRRRRLWPWLAAAVALLALGLWELRVHRRAPTEGPAAVTPEPVRPGQPPSSPAGPGSTPVTPGAPSRRAGIAGRVLTSDGRPAPGVTVVIVSSAKEVRTGDDGRFQLEVDEGTTVRLEAHHSDLGWAAADVRAPATDAQLRLRARAGLDVQVLSEGRPVSGAVVTVQARSGETGPFNSDRTTDASGTLRFLGLPAGPIEVAATSPETGARSSVQLEAREGTVVPVQLVLPVLGVIKGTVVKQGGAPVVGALVGVEAAEGTPAVSGDDGSFILKGLRTGREYRLTARTPELQLDSPVTARAGDSAVRLMLRELPVFKGRVVGPGGAPLQTFFIDGRRIDAADGRFALPLEPRGGQIQFQVGAEGMETRTVQAGSSVSELGDIALQPAPRLSGRVLASGQPVADAEVSAGQGSVRTDASGGFVLAVRDPPPAGTPLLVHAMKGEMAGSAEAQLPGPVDIVIAGEQPVRVRVLGPSGAPAVGKAVQLTGLRTYTWTTGPEGTVEGRALAGDYRASTDAHPGRVWFVQLPASELVLGPASGGWSLEVELSAPVEALWVEKGGAPPQISSDHPGPRGEGQLLFGVERSARFDGLSAGTWTVVGLRQGVPVLRTVQVSGPTRLSL